MTAQEQSINTGIMTAFSGKRCFCCAKTLAFAPVGRKRGVTVKIKREVNMLQEGKTENKNPKSKGGRPKKPITRARTTGIRFTKAEHFVVTEKANKAGLKLTTYIRDMSIKGEVKNRLTEEERGFVRQLIGMSNNLNQVAKACHEEGTLSALRYFEGYRNQVDEVLKRLRQ